MEQEENWVMTQVKKMVERTDEEIFVADVWRERIWHGGGICVLSRQE